MSRGVWRGVSHYYVTYPMMHGMLPIPPVNRLTPVKTSPSATTVADSKNNQNIFQLFEICLHYA